MEGTEADPQLRGRVANAQEIDRKRLVQEGVLVPVTARRNEELLPRGFRPVECFWRSMNFTDWVGVRTK